MNSSTPAVLVFCVCWLCFCVGVYVLPNVFFLHNRQGFREDYLHAGNLKASKAVCMCMVVWRQIPAKHSKWIEFGLLPYWLYSVRYWTQPDALRVPVNSVMAGGYIGRSRRRMPCEVWQILFIVAKKLAPCHEDIRYWHKPSTIVITTPTLVEHARLTCPSTIFSETGFLSVLFILRLTCPIVSNSWKYEWHWKMD